MGRINRGMIVLCIIIAIGLLMGTLGVLSLSEQDDNFTQQTESPAEP